MTTLVEHVTTPLAREAAFAYVADFSRQAEWDPNTVSSKRIDDGELGVGARFALDVKMGTRTTSMEYRITEYQAPSVVVLVGEGSGVWSQDRITFSEAPEGTRVDYVAEIKLSGLLGVIQPLLGRAFAGIAKGAVNGMKRELDALAASGATVAEADASARILPSAKADLPWTRAGSSMTRLRSRSWAASAASAIRLVGASTGGPIRSPGRSTAARRSSPGRHPGLGRAAADSLASLGARVVLVGRSRERLSATAAELAQRHGDAERFPVVVADMSSLASVREAVAAIQASEARLDILVDSAGAIHAERTVTAEGLEATFATMVVGPFVLISGLLPMLEASGDGRVITVVSGGMYGQALPLERPAVRRGRVQRHPRLRAGEAGCHDPDPRMGAAAARSRRPRQRHASGLGGHAGPGRVAAGLLRPHGPAPAHASAGHRHGHLAGQPARGRSGRRAPLPRSAGASLRQAALHAPLSRTATLALAGGRQAGRHPRPGA